MGKKIYNTGNTFIHYSDQLIFASLKAKGVDRIINLTIGQHDEFIPLSEKHGAVYWMREITDGILYLTDLWIKQKEGYNKQAINKKL